MTIPSDNRPVRRRNNAGQPTALLHVNLPVSLVEAIRKLAAEERRTITSQVALLLEESEELQEFIKAGSQ
jgi:hypothetical protein